jgi:hypothetical protein
MRVHVAGDPSEAFRDPVLEAAARHQLHADADAEKGLAAAAHLLVQHLPHAGDGLEPVAAVAERADPGQHDAVGVPHGLGIGGDADRLAEPRSRAARSNAFSAERRLPEP